MSRRRKHSQRHAKGCRLCGDPTIGRGIQKHVQGAHSISYENYLRCFEESGRIITDQLIPTGTADQGTKRVIIHVLVRRFTVPIA